MVRTSLSPSSDSGAPPRPAARPLRPSRRSGDHQLADARAVLGLDRRESQPAGACLAPPTEARIRRRDATYRLLSSRPMTGVFTWLAARTAKTGELTGDPLPAVTA